MLKALILATFLTITAAAAEEEVVVRILGGPRVARMISEEMGYLYKGPVSSFVFQLSNGFSPQFFR